MSVGLLIITHNGIGNSLIKTAVSIMGHCPLEIEVISVPLNCNPQRQNDKALKLASKLDSGEGVLILTDLYGSTPSNIARSVNVARAVNMDKSLLISGLNLPMLLRIFNYPTLDLKTMAEKAISGGQQGVIKS